MIAVAQKLCDVTMFSDTRRWARVVAVPIGEQKLKGHTVFHRVLHQEMMLSQRETLQHSIVEILYPNSLIIKSVIEAGIRKGSFKKVDAPMVIATIIGTINQVLLSKKMCNKLLSKEDSYIPYDDAKFAKRLSDHLKQLMHAHLLTQS